MTFETASTVRPETAQPRRSPKLARSLQSKDSLSGAPFDGKPARLTHGGARLRADRTSDALRPGQARAIILAAHHAHSIGEPFTRMLTVHWERAGIPDSQAAAATGKLTKLASDWTRRRGSRILWAWTRENDTGKGSHLHLLIACPAHLQVGRMWRRWLRTITGRPYRAGTINTRRIGGALAAPNRDQGDYRANLWNAAAYVCKGVRPDDAALLGIGRVEAGGTVIGKRSAVCQPLLKLGRIEAQSVIAARLPFSAFTQTVPGAVIPAGSSGLAKARPNNSRVLPAISPAP
jgi:hypothetical protein